MISVSSVKYKAIIISYKRYIYEKFLFVEHFRIYTFSLIIYGFKLIRTPFKTSIFSFG